MSRPPLGTLARRAALAAALAAAVPLTFPAAAHAAYVDDPTPPPGPDRLSVNDGADVNNSGTRIAWAMKVTCRKGDRFQIYAAIRQSDLPLPPQYAGWTAYATEARGERDGYCTGKAVSVTVKLEVQPTTVIPSPSDYTHPETVFVPMQPTPVVGSSYAKVLTPTTSERSEPFYCGSVDTEECEDATQIGPYLRLY